MKLLSASGGKKFNLKSLMQKRQRAISSELEIKSPAWASRDNLKAPVSAPNKQVSAADALEDAITKALAMGASDIHFDPGVQEIQIRLRMDGVLCLAGQLAKTLQESLIFRIKVLANLRTDEHLAAQDGRFGWAGRDGTKADIRVSIAPTFYGENAVLRLLSSRSAGLGLDLLGFGRSDQEAIAEILARPHGMILVTGPTGSGKTTTLYALIRLLNQVDRSIVTVEDPVEYAISGINQIQVNEYASLNFSSGLRSILRQDPNIIMVGEIRDAETARLAVNTALTGHLLLSSLHTNNAATTLPRLLDLGVEPYLIASTVQLAIGQRLVRKLCPACRQQAPLAAAAAARLEKIFGPDVIGTEFYRAMGCQACNFTGYCGRIGIYELLKIDRVIREAILRKATAEEIQALAEQRGMSPMRVDGLEKAKAGLTAIEEILRIGYE
ncbi:MAG TPA: GspE/PulE family protein [Patescibacteria group bacterium]|nr:GspE/PulE family protein [Patescibacteria group bacterium]